MRCSLLVGMCKTNLSDRDHLQFIDSFAEEFKVGVDGEPTVIKGNNSVVLCNVTDGDVWGDYENVTGGGCFLRTIEYDSDTKEILSSLAGINGSWSAIVLDDSRATVHAGRDRRGAEAVYYAVRDGSLYFSNSITIFRKLFNAIDKRAVADFLHFLYIPEPRTIYQEVKVLPQGYSLSFLGKQVEIKLSTDLTREDSPSNSRGESSENPLSHYERLLQQAVHRTCSGSDKVALFLSGGKDSSALAIAAKLAGANIDCVTVGFNEKAIDESSHAAIVANHLGLPHRNLNFSISEYRNSFVRFIRTLGQPFGDPATLPVFCTIRTLANDYGVYLDGTGIDRYFGVPTTWQEDFVWRFHRLFPEAHRFPWNTLGRVVPSYSISTICKGLVKRREEQFVSWNGWSADEIAELTGNMPDWSDTPLYRLYQSARGATDHKTKSRCAIWGPEACIRKTIQMAESMGKIVRYPFLDRDLISWCERLPQNLKMDGRTNKVILRTLLKKHLPSQIVNKPKGAFVFPKEYILAAEGYSYLDCYLSEFVLRKHGLVDPSVALPFIRRYMRGDRSVEDRVWSLLLLHAWLEVGR